VAGASVDAFRAMAAHQRIMIVAAHPDDSSYLEELKLDANQVARGRTSQLGHEHGVEYAEEFRIHTLG